MGRIAKVTGMMMGVRSPLRQCRDRDECRRGSLSGGSVGMGSRSPKRRLRHLCCDGFRDGEVAGLRIGRSAEAAKGSWTGGSS